MAVRCSSGWDNVRRVSNSAIARDLREKFLQSQVRGEGDVPCDTGHRNDTPSCISRLGRARLREEGKWLRGGGTG